jgi:hypothetical protein
MAKGSVALLLAVASLEADGITEVWVTFASDYDEDATSRPG